MPFIEVKNVKENQYMISLSDDAELNDKYFVIVESHFRDDYLITILVADVPYHKPHIYEDHYS